MTKIFSAIGFTALLLNSLVSAAAIQPTLVCESNSGSGFTGTLVRGAHYDYICDVNYWLGQKSNVQHLKDCTGSLYSSVPGFVLNINNEENQVIAVKLNEIDEQIYTDSLGTQKAHCHIENDFPKNN